VTDEEVEAYALTIQHHAAGLLCPNPGCATGGQIVCHVVVKKDQPMRYSFGCMECLFGSYASDTPEEAREVFLDGCRTIPWNDNKARPPTKRRP
jgi:hypothetical protein